tara:strand:+ start:24481 stop:25047 length:567 start_codon:yes stop_codon:yes gene_type:complete
MKNYYQALAKFKQSVPVIFKGTQGYGYKYADLPTITEIIKPFLKKAGLEYQQDLESEDGKTYISTTLFHVESGENHTSRLEIFRITLKGMNDYQSFGSGITYFRRYSLGVKLGLITDVDNDASGQQIKKSVKPEKPTKKQLNVNQFNVLVGLIQSGDADSQGQVWTIERAEQTFDFNTSQILALREVK